MGRIYQQTVIDRFSSLAFAKLYTAKIPVTASFTLRAYSVPVAFCILTLLILRMVLHKLPHESMAASSWLALGPIGTGSFGMLVLGANSPTIFTAVHLTSIGMAASSIGMIMGTLLWGSRFSGRGAHSLGERLSRLRILRSQWGCPVTIFEQSESLG